MFRRDFQLKMRAWVFPENRYGPVKIVFAVQVDKSEMNDLVGGELAARVIADDHDETMGTWESQISDGDPSPWVRTVRLPAGSYTMVCSRDHEKSATRGKYFLQVKNRRIDATARNLKQAHCSWPRNANRKIHGISEKARSF